MRKQIKIWFYSGASEVRELSFPKPLAYLFSIVILALFSGLIYAGYDYYTLKTSSFNNALLRTQLAQKDGEINAQRKQIQNFASEINQLKDNVKKLCIFEDRVRLIADIQQTSDSSGLIGIGGIPDNDLDYDIEVEEKHNSLIRQMHRQTKQIALAAEKQNQDFELLIKELYKKKNLLAATPSVKPVDGWVTSHFGYRKSPFTGQKEFHSGLDISNKKGEEVIATANGTVSYAGTKMLIGKLVVIDHGHGIVTKYGHLHEINVKRGQKIKRGDVIGLLGNSGRTTGPHVHYEVKINGLAVNPVKYILN